MLGDLVSRWHAHFEPISINVMHVDGMLGDLVSRWNANFEPISTNVMHVGIEIEVKSKELGRIFRIINLYGPYGDKLF